MIMHKCNVEEIIISTIIISAYFWIEEKQYLAFEETPNFEVTFHRGGYLGRSDTISKFNL